MIELLESEELVSVRETRSASRLSTVAAADVSAIAVGVRMESNSANVFQPDINLSIIF